MNPWTYPLDFSYILRNYKAEMRRLKTQKFNLKVRIAILGGSTTAPLADLLTVFLLKKGIYPVFYESDYNQYYEDILFPNRKLQEFHPDILYVHTTCRNILTWPNVQDSSLQAKEKLATTFLKFNELWEKATATYHCTIIQNNWELPRERLLGNRDSFDWRGYSHFVMQLNLRLAEYAQTQQNFYIQDIHYLASSLGLDKWHDESRWYAYKYAISLEGIVAVAENLAIMIGALYGKAKKCLVTDLDNTLWGGVIGDDGVDHIQLGPETPLGEAYLDLQRYIKQLQQRGIILAVCSKNDEAVARQGIEHPNSILNRNDFASFVANWQNKHENLQSIAKNLNIGLDSMVFLDDNPVERQIVINQLPKVTVPDIGSEVINYRHYLCQSGYFEAMGLSDEDLQRASYYQGNAQRLQQSAAYANYDEFLRSLEMRAEIRPFTAIYLDRITQLINKTNQFNLTTRRYTLAEIQSIAENATYITLYGKLSDKFGDNGIVSVVIGHVEVTVLVIELWIMSCRVLKRGLERAMFDRLVSECQRHGITRIQGTYLKTVKNAMVADFYGELGFELVNKDSLGNCNWQFTLSPAYQAQNKWMVVESEG